MSPIRLTSKQTFMHFLRSFHWWKILPGSISAIAIGGAFQLGLFQDLEHLAYNALFRLRGSQPWSPSIAIIEVDETTLQALGQFPIPRRHYTTLLNQLATANPTAVVLDILFVEASPEDDALAQAMANQGHVVLPQSWDASGELLVPTPQLLEGAIGTGHVYMFADSDGVARTVQTALAGVPALSIVAADVHSLVYAEVEQPDLTRPFWINWPGPSETAEHYSLIDVLRGDVSLQRFQNKIVVIGVTAAATDSLKTPYDWNPPSSGVYFQAAAISNLLEGTMLYPVGKLWVLGVLMLGGPGLGWMLCRWTVGRQVMTWLGLSFVWPFVSVLFLHHYTLMPTATPIALFISTGVLVAVSEQWRTYLRLKQSEERYALAVSGSNEGIWDWDLTTQHVYFSPRWKATLGYAEHEIGTRPEDWFDRVHPDDQEGLRQAIATHLQGETDCLAHEYRMIHRDGSERWMLTRAVAIGDRHHPPRRMAGSQTDITERKQAQAQVLHNAYYDALTNLPNRVFLIDRLQRILDSHPPDSPVLLAVVLIDLDRFQLINNSFGNPGGDHLLIAVAQRFQNYLSSDQVLARVGSNEFAILLPEVRDPDEATQLTHRLQAALAQPFYLDQREVFITASMGIVVNSPHLNQPEHWLRDADTAMFHAKELGKSCFTIFRAEMRDRLLSRLQLENDLRHVLNEPGCPGLMLYYQPIVYLSTRQIVSFEALLRWQHPQRGLILPGEFIPMAEETGLIVPLGEWVLQRACRQMQRWTAQFPDKSQFCISVNLARKQFDVPNLPDIIRTTLDDASLDAAHLKLEITESTVMDNADDIITMLYQLRSLGIQLAIDDFGTGYSSLSYLRRFPIDSLKIDRSFVSTMAHENDSFTIVQTIVDLAHNLGLDVTAEGLETLEHSTQLQAIQCEYGQGYFFSHPVSAEKATRLLEDECASIR